MRRLDNFSRFQSLTKEFKVFTYESFRYELKDNSIELEFFFNLSERHYFRPHITIPIKQVLYRPTGGLDTDSMDNLVFHIGMIELISYWKAACSPKLIIKPYKLSEEQVKFWKKLYYQGLGEFFYVNSIPAQMDDFLEITSFGENPLTPFAYDASDGCLVPVGGGKDSAVTMGLFNKAGESWLPFVINPRKTTRDIILAAGKTDDQSIEFLREIHPELLELNAKGFLNGHTPFSALLAFNSLLAAYLSGRSEIVLSNESSANEATVPGTSINHQYSKSFEFEKDFRDYCRDVISPGFNYFSLLRPLSELQIAGLFSEMPWFFSSFRSCNAGSKTDSWCGTCPKCLFTFIILSPFIAPATLSGIFGRNLLDNPALENTLEELAGIAAVKPFECIGTVDEVNVALNEAIKKYDKDELPYLLRVFLKYPHREIAKGNLDGKLHYPDKEHFVPSKYLKMLENVTG